MVENPFANIDPATLNAMPKGDLVKLAQNLAALKHRAAKLGPQTDDELHALIVEKWGIYVPRIAVDIDRGHCAPFDLIADIYFFRVTSALVVGGRDSGKTFGVAIVHALLARFYPGYEGITAGAVEEQSKKAYSTLKKLNATWGGKDAKTTERMSKGPKESDIESTLISETLYKNTSLVAILGGTVAKLNGPHSNLLHRDEAELFRDDAWNEANNITRTGRTTDGRVIPAVDVITSSLKYAHGRLQELMDKVDDAIKNNRPPPYKVYKWGVAETIERQTNCRHDPANAQRPDVELCTCNQFQNGYWEKKDTEGNPLPRTLDSVCNGRFSRSDGYRPLHPDIVNKFMTNPKNVWEAQQECIKPAAEGLILAEFDKEYAGVKHYAPDPENGPIFNSTDFGGTNPHASNWYQYTNKPVAAIGYFNQTIIIPAHSYVVFDEIYITEIGNTQLATMVLGKEDMERQRFPSYEINERYADIAQKAGRLDWRNYISPTGEYRPLPTSWRITREVDEHILLCQGIVNQRRLFVDVVKCPMFIKEAEAWQLDPKTGKQIDVFNHCMSNFRYMIANHNRLMQIRGEHMGQDVNEAGAVADEAPKEKVNDHNLAQMPTTGPASTSLRDDPYGDAMPVPIHAGVDSSAFSDVEDIWPDSL